MNREKLRIVTIMLMLAGFTGMASAGEDVLVLKNGDHLTGEIKKLVGGDIHIDADYGENIFIIDWGEGFSQRLEQQSRTRTATT